tara:strand:+ start:1811 stop:2464 length:654 start_codon:yes stop_codon:yes gene_type:complete
MFYLIKNKIMKGHIYSNKTNFLILFITLILISCTVTLDKASKYMALENIDSILPLYRKLESLIVVNISTQQLFLLKKGSINEIYSISTSVYGTGSKVNSFKTPLGRHKISEKIGKGLPEGAILKGRIWTGAIANIIKEPIDTEFDVVTSRILWLTGLEVGKNKGPGVDSKSRYIYIHGTAEEGLIGKPASDGCVRMYNVDIIDLFNKVDTNTEVLII